MISCPNQFCDTGEKLTVLRPGDPKGPYYCRSCGYVVTKEKTETLAASAKFKAAVVPLAPVEPDDPPVEARVAEIPREPAKAKPGKMGKVKSALRGTKKSTKKGGKK